MYEAVRSRAPNSTKVVGVTMAVLLTGAAGYGFSTEFGDRFVAAFEPPITVVATLPQVIEEVEPPADVRLD